MPGPVVELEGRGRVRLIGQAGVRPSSRDHWHDDSRFYVETTRKEEKTRLTVTEWLGVLPTPVLPVLMAASSFSSVDRWPKITPSEVRTLLLQEPDKHLFISKNSRNERGKTLPVAPSKWYPHVYVGGASSGVLGVMDYEALRGRGWLLLCHVLQNFDGTFPGLIIVEHDCVLWEASCTAEESSGVQYDTASREEPPSLKCKFTRKANYVVDPKNMSPSKFYVPEIPESFAQALEPCIRIMDLSGGWPVFAHMYPELRRPDFVHHPQWKNAKEYEEEWLPLIFSSLKAEHLEPNEVIPNLSIGHHTSYTGYNDLGCVIHLSDSYVEFRMIEKDFQQSEQNGAAPRLCHLPIDESVMTAKNVLDAAANVLTEFNTLQGQDSVGKRLLVQCSAGINRSVSAVMLFLRWRDTISLAKAFCMIAVARPTACPSEAAAGFLHQIDLGLQRNPKNCSLPWYYSLTGNRFGDRDGEFDRWHVHADWYATLGWDLPVLEFLRTRGSEIAKASVMETGEEKEEGEEDPETGNSDGVAEAAAELLGRVRARESALLELERTGGGEAE